MTNILVLVGRVVGSIWTLAGPFLFIAGSRVHDVQRGLSPATVVMPNASSALDFYVFGALLIATGILLLIAAQLLENQKG